MFGIVCCWRPVCSIDRALDSVNLLKFAGKKALDSHCKDNAGTFIDNCIHHKIV